MVHEITNNKSERNCEKLVSEAEQDTWDQMKLHLPSKYSDAMLKKVK